MKVKLPKAGKPIMKIGDMEIDSFDIVIAIIIAISVFSIGLMLRVNSSIITVLLILLGGPIMRSIMIARHKSQ